jgi:hypothetical protein
LLLLLLGSHQMHPQSLHLLLPQFLHKNLFSNWATWSSRRLQNQLPARGGAQQGRLLGPVGPVAPVGPVDPVPVAQSGCTDRLVQIHYERVWLHGPVGTTPVGNKLVSGSGSRVQFQ